MAVVVNDAAPVAQAIGAQTDACAAKRPQADALAQNRGRLDLQDAAALGHNRGGRGGIGLEIRTQLIRSTENAIPRARDRVHER